MLTADGSALVNGQRLPAEAMMRVKALRGFYFDGEAIRKDEEATVPYRLAKELCALGKAAWVETPAPSAPSRPFLKLEGALAITPSLDGQKRKGPRHAVK